MTHAGDIIRVHGLSVSYRHGAGWNRVVDDVGFAVAKGEVLGLVGESGCGKSTVALQLLGFRHPSLRVDTGEVMFDGANLVKLSRTDLDLIRGRRVSYVPQNPTTALNPGIRVGAQIAEVLDAHRVQRAERRIPDLFELVGLPSDQAFRRRYPHQLSGGQQQRVCIAMALACDPELVILDEPTTGLDVTTQEQIVSLLIGLRARLGMSMLYVTHDLALLSQIADRIGVMYAGRMVEIAPTGALFEAARHPYTQGLIGSIPRIDEGEFVTRPLRGLLRRSDLPRGCPFAPRCDHALERCFAEPQTLQAIADRHEVACWRWPDIAVVLEAKQPRQSKTATSQPLLSLDSVSIAYGKGSRRFTAVKEASFTIDEGETLALVGESGSGKSTLARAVSGLIPPSAGRIGLRKSVLEPTVKARSREERRLIQFIFQNPDASLNPRARIGTTLKRPVEMFFPNEARSSSQFVETALSGVRLDASYAGRYPDQLSGGERQRVAIARALIARPSLLLCDEVLSALDVSVQANILALLQRLKNESNIAMLFISHDLAVVRMIADRVCVLFGGEIMEIGTRDAVFAPPYHPYTFSLLEAVPTPLKQPRAAARSRRRAPTPDSRGCVYAGRCPWQLGPVCETDRPPWRETSGGLRIRCHIPLDDLNTRAANTEREQA